MVDEYITSERFIHDQLVKQADSSVRTLYKSWAKSKRIDPFLVTWPAETVMSKEGVPIEGACVLELKPFPPEERRKRIMEALRLTSAYALLLVEQHENEVRAILESKHGAHSWHLALKKRGGDVTLGNVTSQQNQSYVGLLWSPAAARA